MGNFQRGFLPGISGANIPMIPPSGNTVVVKDDNVVVVAAAQSLNFVSPLKATNVGGTQADITLEGFTPQFTNSVQTIDATPVFLFGIVPPTNKTGLATVSVSARALDQINQVALVRIVRFESDGVNASWSPLIHATFTDKTKEQYALLFTQIGPQLVISVRGANGDTIDWFGKLEYQISP